MSEYLKNATSFVGFPLKKRDKHYPNHKYLCPVCKGHGGWNLRLNAYGRGQHFNASCFQCAGWGWVGKEDARCIHDFQDYAVPANHRSGMHYARCTKCKRETSYDARRPARHRLPRMILDRKEQSMDFLKCYACGYEDDLAEFELNKDDKFCCPKCKSTDIDLSGREKQK